MSALGDSKHSQLNDHQAGQMHQACLDILESTGVQLYEREAVDLLRDASCRAGDEILVWIPPDLVEHAIAVAPKEVTIYDRNGGTAPWNQIGWRDAELHKVLMQATGTLHAERQRAHGKDPSDSGETWHDLDCLLDESFVDQ